MFAEDPSHHLWEPDTILTVCGALNLVFIALCVRAWRRAGAGAAARWRTATFVGCAVSAVAATAVAWQLLTNDLDLCPTGIMCLNTGIRIGQRDAAPLFVACAAVQAIAAMVLFDDWDAVREQVNRRFGNTC